MNQLRIALIFTETTPEGEIVQHEKYGARIADPDTDRLAEYASNTVKAYFPSFKEAAK